MTDLEQARAHLAELRSMHRKLANRPVQQQLAESLTGKRITAFEWAIQLAEREIRQLGGFPAIPECPYCHLPMDLMMEPDHYECGACPAGMIIEPKENEK